MQLEFRLVDIYDSYSSDPNFGNLLFATKDMAFKIGATEESDCGVPEITLSDPTDGSCYPCTLGMHPVNFDHLQYGRQVEADSYELTWILTGPLTNAITVQKLDGSAWGFDCPEIKFGV